MRLTALLALICITAASAVAQDDAGAAAPELKTLKQRVSYAIGVNIGRNLQQQEVDVDPQILAQAIATILADQPSALSNAEMQEVFTAMQEEQAKMRAAAGEAAKAAGEKFLAENAKKEGVKVTKSGLQYKVIRPGTGQKPTKSNTVSTHYRGRFIDGKVFDQSYEGDAPVATDEPVSFGVTQVISGWTEALQLMQVGAKYQLYIPSDLAYGPQGRPGIPPNSTLVFDIELLNVK